MKTIKKILTFIFLIILTIIIIIGYKGYNMYKEAIEEVDRDLGIVYKAFKDANLLDDTLFICVSDHGHTIKGGHGKESDSEKQTMLAVAGRKGDIITGSSGYYVTQDLAAIVLYALGVEQPEYFDGRVPTNLFNTIG